MLETFAVNFLGMVRFGTCVSTCGAPLASSFSAVFREGTHEVMVLWRMAIDRCLQQALIGALLVNWVGFTLSVQEQDL